MSIENKDKPMDNSPKVVNPAYFKKLIRNFWLLFIGILLISIGIFLALSMTNLPDTKELENPTFEYATKIFTEDGKELGRYFRKNRDWVYPKDLNPHLVNALVSTEDERFYGHSGIDYKGTLRAIVFLGKRGGASTITQQLAKLLFHERSKSFIPRVIQKFKEWIIALRIEKRYTKEEIISMYLNKFDFIHDSDGIAAASNTYFGKDQKSLEIEEAATLIGMLKNPYIFNPQKFPKRAKLRREVVLNQMRKNDVIDDEQYEILRKKPLDMSNFKRQEDSEGLAPYFRTELTKWLKKILDQDEYKKPDGTRYNMFTDGLRIYTTIDYKMQEYAESAVRNNMINVQDRYFDRWANRDPWTFNADDNQKKIRANSLNMKIRETELYLLMYDEYMSSITNTIKTNIQTSDLREIDVIRMIRQEKDKNYFDKIMEAKWASKEQIASYRSIMKSSYFEKLKNQYSKLDKAVDKKFATPKSMKVYDYKTGGFKKVIMSPLDSIKFHSQHMQSGMLAIEPSTGYVKAWVGGINHKFFQYDHITSNRQVGSTFKPFIYASAIFLQGISPCWKVDDIQYSIPAKDPDFGLMQKWSPSNSDGKFSGKKLTLYEGLKQSKNSVSVYLMKQLGNVREVQELAGNMGIPKEKIPSSPSICLGTPELSLMDMTSAYSTFANNGLHNSPIFVTRIEDKDGQLIFSNVSDQNNALPADYNYAMVDMLKNAASFIAKDLTSEIGGKTGTTNDFVDGWFMGITPNLVVGTWVGGEDPWIRFTNITDGQGGTMARPTFVDFISRLENDPSVKYDKYAKFPVPENLDLELNCSKYDNPTLPDNGDEYIDQGNDDAIEDDGEDYFDDIDGQ